MDWNLDHCYNVVPILLYESQKQKFQIPPVKHKLHKSISSNKTHNK